MEKENLVSSSSVSESPDSSEPLDPYEEFKLVLRKYLPVMIVKCAIEELEKGKSVFGKAQNFAISLNENGKLLILYKNSILPDYIQNRRTVLEKNDFFYVVPEVGFYWKRKLESFHIEDILRCMIKWLFKQTYETRKLDSMFDHVLENVEGLECLGSEEDQKEFLAILARIFNGKLFYHPGKIYIEFCHETLYGKYSNLNEDFKDLVCSISSLVTS